MMRAPGSSLPFRPKRARAINAGVIDEGRGLEAPPREEFTAFSKLRHNFEGRRAIYIEHGALLVCVSDIRPGRTTVAAQIDEVPAAGLGVGSFDPRHLKRATPLRWTIRGGFLTEFSDHCWVAGYGSWSLYFEPSRVHSVLQLAGQFADTVDTSERYRQIVRLLQSDQADSQGKWQRVFPAVREPTPAQEG